MVETWSEKLRELEEYLKNPCNYRNADNSEIGVGNISQYSILDLKEEKEQSRLIELAEEVSVDKTYLQA